MSPATRRADVVEVEAVDVLLDRRSPRADSGFRTAAAAAAGPVCRGLPGRALSSRDERRVLPAPACPGGTRAAPSGCRFRCRPWSCGARRPARPALSPTMTTARPGRMPRSRSASTRSFHSARTRLAISLPSMIFAVMASTFRHVLALNRLHANPPHDEEHHADAHEDVGDAGSFACRLRRNARRASAASSPRSTPHRPPRRCRSSALERADHDHGPGCAFAVIPNACCAGASNRPRRSRLRPCCRPRTTSSPPRAASTALPS